MDDPLAQLEDRERTGTPSGPGAKKKGEGEGSGDEAEADVTMDPGEEEDDEDNDDYYQASAAFMGVFNDILGSAWACVESASKHLTWLRLNVTGCFALHAWWLVHMLL